MRPCIAFDERGFILLFSLKLWDPLRPKYPKKNRNPNIRRKKRKQKTPVTRKMLGRGTLNPCAKFQGLSQKRRGHWTLKEFVVLCLNQPACVS